MKKGIIKTFTFMFSAIFLAKVLGLVRNIVFANFYGTGFEATAFFTASRIPLQLLDMTLGAAISSTFIPIFNEYLQKDGKKRAIQFANNFLNVIMVVSLILTVLGIIFAPQIVSIIAPDLEVQTLNLTIQLIKILFPIMIFTAVAYVLVGFLQSMDEFRIPSIISAVANGILILYLAVFNNKFGVKGVAIAMLIAWATQIIVQIPAVIKKGFKYKFSIDFKDEGLKKILKLAPPILISTWVQPINNIVNIRLASGLQDGQAVSALEYSYNLYLIIVGVFSYTLSNIIFPELSKLTADNNKNMIIEVLNKSIKISLFLIIPMSVGIGVLSNDIIRLIYERGEFTATSTYLTGGALTYYAIGMIGYGIMEILNKAFYAMQDSKTPMKVSAVAIVMNIILSICLVKVNDYLGLPLAASITSVITAVIMVYAINKDMNGIVNKKTVVEFLKTIVSALIMGIVVYLIEKINLKYQIVTLALSVVTGVITYLAMMLVLKSETIDEFKKILKLRR